MVTKDSGDEGGTEEKIKGAIETGVNVVLIKRPKINYINLYDNIYDIIKVIDKDLKK
jgi:precorrin-6A/cobalt-precorrin-6A reductase